MTDVSDWARREASRQVPEIVRGDSERYDDWEIRLDANAGERDGFASGIIHLADLLLSDKAVEAAAISLRVSMTTTTDTFEDCYRAALQAALTAITNPETPSSGTTEQTGA